MASLEPGAIVAVEAFAERDVIAPVRVGLEDEVVSEHRPTSAPCPVAQEDPYQPPRDLISDLSQARPTARPELYAHHRRG